MKQLLIKGLKKIYRILPLKSKTKKRIKSFFLKKKNQDDFLNKDNFLKRVSKYEVISFDIFDTLISRLVFEPDDLFDIMNDVINSTEKLEIPYKQMRKSAEQLARETLKKDCNLDEIYQFMGKKYCLSKKKVEQYKKLEINLELALCIPRSEMLEVFNKLKQQNKKIILTSDMYLSKKVIEKLLDKSGYSGYDYLFLSNVENKRKDTKEIWKSVLEKYPKKKIIHIGDNEYSDVNYPKEFSIDTIKVKSGKEFFESSEIKIYLEKNIYERTPSDSIQLGFIINKTLFNSPFTNGKINNLNEFSYAYIGPMILSLMEFIDAEAKEKDRILFLAREGYNLQKLYKEYCKIFGNKEIKSNYFLASRRAVTNATVETKRDIEVLCKKTFEGEIKDFFKEVLGISYQKKSFYIKLPDDFDKVIKEVEQSKNQIFKASAIQKKNYLSYINQEIPEYSKKKLCLVDLGYSGTIQYYLTKMLKKEILGIYLTNSDNVKRYSQNSELHFCFDINEEEKYKKVYYYSLVLEFFLSAPYGQLLGFGEKNGKIYPIYNNETMDKNKEHNIEIIYQSVIAYMKDIQEIRKVYNINLNKEIIFQNYISAIETKLLSYDVKDLFRFIDAYNEIKEYNVFERIGQY